MFKLLTTESWFDIKKNAWRLPGDEVSLSDLKRIKILLNAKVVRPLASTGKVKGSDVILFVNSLQGIGGIETSILNLVRSYPNRIKIVVKLIDSYWFLEISKYADIIVDKDMKGRYTAKVVILTQFDSNVWLDLLTKRPDMTYQQVHADYSRYKEIRFNPIEYLTDPRIDKLLPVSEAAQAGLKNRYGLEAECLPNAVNPKREQPLLIGFFSRSTEEKNPKGLLKFIETVNNSEHEAVFLISSNTFVDCREVHESLVQIPNVLMLNEPKNYSPVLIPKLDYLIQLSTAEASCEVVREALDNHVPVIVSNIPAFKYIKDGVLGYHVEDEGVSAKTLDKIFNKKPVITDEIWHRETDKRWEKVLKGTL